MNIWGPDRRGTYFPSGKWASSRTVGRTSLANGFPSDFWVKSKFTHTDLSPSKVVRPMHDNIFSVDETVTHPSKYEVGFFGSLTKKIFQFLYILFLAVRIFFWLVWHAWVLTTQQIYNYFRVLSPTTRCPFVFIKLSFLTLPAWILIVFSFSCLLFFFFRHLWLAFYLSLFAALIAS